MKSFAMLTMKSKQVWMKSSLSSDEIKSVFISLRSKISSTKVDLFRRKTDLVEKRLFRRIVFFLAGLEGLEPPNAGIRIRCLTNLAIAQYFEHLSIIPKIIAVVNTFFKKVFKKMCYLCMFTNSMSLCQSSRLK